MSATTASALTHDEFVAKLDAICESGNAHNAELDKETDKATNANDYAKLAAVLEQRQRLVAPERDSVEQLVAPPADAAAFARYKAMNLRIDGLVDRLIVALKAKDLAEVNRLISLASQAQNKRTNAALDLGTQHCGS